MASEKDLFFQKGPSMPSRASCSSGNGVLRTLALFCAALPLRSALELEAIQGSNCLRVVLKAGDSIKADPRCVVSRGRGLIIEPAVETKSGFMRQFRRMLLMSVEEQRDPLHTLSNKIGSNATDCMIAPLFPGDLAIVSIQDPNARPLDTHQTQGKGHRKRADHKRLPSTTRRDRGRTDEDSATTGKGTTRNLVAMTQALVAVGPDVSVTPMGRRSKLYDTIHRKAQVEPPGSKATSMSQCSGNGPVAIAGCGKLMRVRLRAGQRRAVDSTRAVGWTEGVTWAPVGEKKSDNGGPGAVVNFEGPGVVFIQTQSIASLRRLFAPGIGHGERGWARKSEATRGRSVGLSLKRGIAKRARAGARRMLQAAAFSALYLALYSVVTAFLLDGWKGLANAPRHAVKVVSSLVNLVRIAVVVIRLALEESWSGGRQEQGGGGHGTEHPRLNVPGAA